MLSYVLVTENRVVPFRRALWLHSSLRFFCFSFTLSTQCFAHPAAAVFFIHLERIWGGVCTLPKGSAAHVIIRIGNGKEGSTLAESPPAHFIAHFGNENYVFGSRANVQDFPAGGP